LKKLKGLEAAGVTDLFYGDQSAFSMNPNVPYGWQEKRKSIKIVPSSQAKRLLMFLAYCPKKNELEAYESQGTMTSAVLIAFIDDFVARRKQKTTIVLDKAPIHKSEAFQQAVKRWQK
jgi:hypothetical protein